MLVLVTGGSASGKSAFAEGITERIHNGNGSKYYLAFMKNDSKTAEKRIERHRKLREGKGFITLEIPCDVDMELEKTLAYSVQNIKLSGTHEKECTDISGKEKWYGSDTVLMESVGVLLANEMFKDGIVREDAGKYVLEELLNAAAYFENVVIVGEDVFSDGNEYDEYSLKYIEALGYVNRGISKKADAVAEVVCSYPIWIKGEVLGRHIFEAERRINGTLCRRKMPGKA